MGARGTDSEARKTSTPSTSVRCIPSPTATSPRRLASRLRWSPWSLISSSGSTWSPGGLWYGNRDETGSPPGHLEDQARLLEERSFPFRGGWPLINLGERDREDAAWHSAGKSPVPRQRRDRCRNANSATATWRSRPSG